MNADVAQTTLAALTEMTILINSEDLIVKARTFTRMAVAAAIAALGMSTAAAQSGGAVVNPDLSYEDVKTTVRQLAEPFLRDGPEVPIEHILSVRRGTPAQRVRELLGEPAARSENGAEWDYHLRLPLGEKRPDRIVCQFKVIFEDGVVAEAAWRRKQCQAIAGSLPLVVGLESDSLFGFDQSGLSGAGMQALDGLYRQLELDRRAVSMLIIGHTDRLGPDAYNQALSEQRARTVADYMVQRGIPAAAIRTMGAGKSQPVVGCAGTRPTAELKRCLAPNRRVSIEIR